jgi:hypothetical protein
MRGYPASLQYSFRKASDSVASTQYPVPVPSTSTQYQYPVPVPSTSTQYQYPVPVPSVLTEDVWTHTEYPAGAREIRFSLLDWQLGTAF